MGLHARGGSHCQEQVRELFPSGRFRILPSFEIGILKAETQ